MLSQLLSGIQFVQDFLPRINVAVRILEGLRVGVDQDRPSVVLVG